MSGDVPSRRCSGTLSGVDPQQGNAPNERDWAAKHYRVERDSTGVKTSRRKLKRIAEQAARYGDPIPTQSHDVVRILDRDGVIVSERDWGGNRDAAAEEEGRIVDDLLHLDVVQFRAKYGLVVGLAAEPDDEGEAEPADAGPEGKPEGASG